MKRCMIVDDSSVIRKVAKRILSSTDMLVIEAATGGQALEMCNAEMPDYIIVDSTLEDMNVVDFIRETMAIPSPIRPQILLCVIQMDVGAIMRAKRAGAIGYVMKPFNRPQLIEKFRTVTAATVAAA